jgi:hypothetical protein
MRGAKTKPPLTTVRKARPLAWAKSFRGMPLSCRYCRLNRLYTEYAALRISEPRVRENGRLA